ncbi:deoxyribodipyrimidine photo-lyase type I [Marinobacterium lutimaris]|uniref:Deoxyribodipyrimidine photo-lyase type I n=2 Tax=Marinobacterium lutimaris TaxID=568106 RepID=A0A1H5ZBP7_9GAMM|nr:deoxyribodipyrimidine photo-lyase type I [Marinobacterium lutimaris]
MDTHSMAELSLIWLRNDLRLADNPALTWACKQAKKTLAVVTLTPQSWESHGESAARMGLWRDQLRSVAEHLQELNIPLRVLRLDSFDDCAPALTDLVRELNTGALAFNYEYPLNERNRDQTVCKALESVGVEVRGFHGELIIPPGQVLTGQGGPFKVYTPFSRAWRRRLADFDRSVLPVPEAQQTTGLDSDPVPDDLDYKPLQYREDLWQVGEEAVSERLNCFIDEREPDYADKRDFPALPATSALSPYLTIGAISPRQCMASLRAAAGSRDWLESSWLNEIIWREFYRHLLVAFPGLSRLEPFRPEVEEKISWLKNDAAFEAWCRGETGFPIVDAAMKQLLETGWMHNRLRMVVASFLTKLLRVDWRLGADFFMRHLIDADFASNLGGWQWSSSVGADAAPYFRIFNPQAQGEKFDAEGRFVARWLPQLESVKPGKSRQIPGAGAALGRPEPVIDYKKARAASLDDYQN